mmetsp:Transcript_1641/g.4985  ORF Transcript_1641/g.4985 Transcript_1641/m.4985 type:complete len:286 (-) Transcript_1641:33-890(-)
MVTLSIKLSSSSFDEILGKRLRGNEDVEMSDGLEQVCDDSGAAVMEVENFESNLKRHCARFEMIIPKRTQISLAMPGLDRFDLHANVHHLLQDQDPFCSRPLNLCQHDFTTNAAGLFQRHLELDTDKRFLVLRSNRVDDGSDHLESIRLSWDAPHKPSPLIEEIGSENHQLHGQSEAEVAEEPRRLDAAVSASEPCRLLEKLSITNSDARQHFRASSFDSSHGFLAQHKQKPSSRPPSCLAWRSRSAKFAGLSIADSSRHGADVNDVFSLLTIRSSRPLSVSDGR